MADKLFDQFNKSRFEIEKAVQRSAAWFNQQAVSMQKARMTPQAVLNRDATKQRSRLAAGWMYMFIYDPKTKDKLPYWDTFPLVLPWMRINNGFIGLNLHYLPYKARVVLLDRLLEFKTTKALTERTKISYSYELIASAAKFEIAKPCIRQYLTSHVRSPFRKVDAPYWTMACMLPVQQFQHASAQELWAKIRMR